MLGWERWLLLGLVAVAAGFDLRWRRVPNPLVLAGTLLALGLAWPAQWWSAVAGLAVGGLPLLLPYARGWMGAGDVKLSAMVGAFLGPQGALLVLFWTALAGGPLALVYLARQRAAGRDENNRPLLPYAVAIAVGTTVVVLSMRG